MNLHYFDFEPPPEWSGFRKGAQIRLIPPFTHPDDAKVAIVVSPLVPRSEALPPAATLIQQTLDAETALYASRVRTQNGPMPTRSDHGLAGIYYDVVIDAGPASGPDGGASIESATSDRRLYVMLVDELCYYGLSYIAQEAVFAEHVETFWRAVRTIKPFLGKIALPVGFPFDHFSE